MGTEACSPKHNNATMPECLLLTKYENTTKPQGLRPDSFQNIYVAAKAATSREEMRGVSRTSTPVVRFRGHHRSQVLTTNVYRRAGQKHQKSNLPEVGGKSKG